MKAHCGSDASPPLPSDSGVRLLGPAPILPLSDNPTAGSTMSHVVLCPAIRSLPASGSVVRPPRHGCSRSPIRPCRPDTDAPQPDPASRTATSDNLRASFRNPPHGSAGSPPPIRRSADPPFDRSGRRSSRPAPGRTKRRLHETGLPPRRHRHKGCPTRLSPSAHSVFGKVPE